MRDELTHVCAALQFVTRATSMTPSLGPAQVPSIVLFIVLPAHMVTLLYRQSELIVLFGEQSGAE